jgi:ubiquinone/menaquinone biosynthesis C-methylase UbiE
MEAHLDYGNWIRKKNLLILGVFTLAAGALIFIPFSTLYHLIVIILFVIVLISFLFPLYASLMFSQKGGRFQEKIYHLIIQNLGANLQGNILDIGTGNGVLAVMLAQAYPAAEVTGIDYWGKDWEYSKSICEQNARAAKVEKRLHFQKGDAAALDFATNTLDSVVSNLTFHEVKSVADKRELVREALRVLKPGGAFAFVDYFYDSKYYGKISEFESFLGDLELSQFECKPLEDMLYLPLLLRHPKILGRTGIVYGRKSAERD